MVDVVRIATIDSLMRGVDKDKNFGATTSLQLGVRYLGADKATLDRPIANFDVSGIDPANVVSARLEQYVTAPVGGAWGAKVFRCTRPAQWTEAGVTWNKYDGTNNWTTEGGDYDTATPAPVAFTAPTTTGLFLLHGMKDMVVDAIDNRAGVLSVILVKDDEDPGVSEAYSFASRESTGEKFRVVIEVPAGPEGGGFNMRNFWP
jgi:hypothetical protein